MAAPTRQDWVQSLLPLAQQWEAKTGIPASMWLAMAASESNWGAAGNSLFGIKGSGNAGSLNSPTWESVNGQRVNQSADFAAYQNANDAFQGFWDLVTTSPRYAGALQQLRQGDPQGFLQGINAAGYATDPKWANSIQSLASTTITPMIQSGGGTTMGQMQAGNPPPPDNRPALPGQMSPGPATAEDPEIAAIIAAAADGDPAAPTPPQGDPVGDPALVDPNGVASGMDGTTLLRILEAKYNLPHTQARLPNGDMTTTDPQTYEKKTLAYTTRYQWTNGKTLDIVTPTQQGLPNYALRGSALADLGNTAHSNGSHSDTGPDAPWIVYFDNDGKMVGKDPNPNYQKGAGAKSTVSSADNSNPMLVHFDANGNITGTERNPNYIPPPPPDPIDQAYKKALTDKANVDTAVSQKSLRPLALAAIQDAGATIEAIKQQWVSGALGTGREAAQKAQALMDQVSQGLSATLAGTTIFDLNKQAQDTATQRANTAASLVNQRVQSSSSLGAALFSAATANGGILMPKGGGRWNINPLDIANQEVNQMGGGQQTGDAATAFLRSVFGGGSPAAGASPTDAGAPPQGQFPTTREAVLAQYPHLATPPPTQNAQFIPPNLEQGAGGPGIAPMQQTAPTVLPPRPLSPANARMQAGG